MGSNRLRDSARIGFRPITEGHGGSRWVRSTSCAFWGFLFFFLVRGGESVFSDSGLGIRIRMVAFSRSLYTRPSSTKRSKIPEKAMVSLRGPDAPLSGCPNGILSLLSLVLVDLAHQSGDARSCLLPLRFSQVGVLRVLWGQWGGAWLAVWRGNGTPELMVGLVGREQI